MDFSGCLNQITDRDMNTVNWSSLYVWKHPLSHIVGRLSFTQIMVIQSMVGLLKMGMGMLKYSCERCCFKGMFQKTINMLKCSVVLMACCRISSRWSRGACRIGKPWSELITSIVLISELWLNWRLQIQSPVGPQRSASLTASKQPWEVCPRQKSKTLQHFLRHSIMRKWADNSNSSGPGRRCETVLSGHSKWSVHILSAMFWFHCSYIATGVTVNVFVTEDKNLHVFIPIYSITWC